MRLAERIRLAADKQQSLDDEELLRTSRKLVWRAQANESLRRLLPDAYALVFEAARRTLGLEYFPVQIVGAITLFQGGIAQMQTGEGKTLTAVLPTYLRALTGQGCHVITVNDYLAKRDAETMGPIFKRLGMNVGCVLADMSPDERRSAYACDVTYGTAKEIGFDFLRDRLQLGAAFDPDFPMNEWNAAARPAGVVQRSHHFALIDEVDSILIDDARTPLIIAAASPNEAAEMSLFRWCDHVACSLENNKHFGYAPEEHSIYLTDAGLRRVVLFDKPPAIASISMDRIYKQVELSLQAQQILIRDRDYLVVKDEVVIVDESTGRVLEGRKWQDGLHHAIEAKERMPITAGTQSAARVTVQSLFRQYRHLAGMTGTAVSAAREFRKIYGLRVSAIPTNRPCIRIDHPHRIFVTLEAKRHAIVEEIRRLIGSRRPVLVGTPSVNASELLSRLLEVQGIDHQVLNARHLANEAEIISRAGQSALATIATNMAGRGTDITLAEAVRSAGGLAVIATEMHSSARIDRQLVGRAARQGDPGSCQFFLSFEDELFRATSPRILSRIRARLQSDAAGEVAAHWISEFRAAQRRLERFHRKQRRQLLKHEQRQIKLHRKLGFDPYLELTD